VHELDCITSVILSKFCQPPKVSGESMAVVLVGLVPLQPGQQTDIK